MSTLDTIIVAIAAYDEIFALHPFLVGSLIIGCSAAMFSSLPISTSFPVLLGRSERWCDGSDGHRMTLAPRGLRHRGSRSYAHRVNVGGKPYAAALRKALRQAAEERFCRCRGNRGKGKHAGWRACIIPRHDDPEGTLFQRDVLSCTLQVLIGVNVYGSRARLEC